MRKMSLAIAGLAFASLAGGFATSTAAPQNCTPTGSTEAVKQRTASDGFGSCETTDGTVKCGRDNATDVGGLGYLIVDQNKGAQVCSEDGQAAPIAGRITVYKHSGNKVTVALDGGDKKNSGGAAAWDRVDVDADNGRACAWRGSTGTYWTKSGSTSSPDSVNQCTS